MPRFKTFANLGSLIPSDIDRLVSEINASMGMWRTIFGGSAVTMMAGFDVDSMNHVLAPGQLMILGPWKHVVDVSGGVFPVGIGDNEGQGAAEYSYLLYLDPQNYGARTGRLRWRTQLACGGDSLSSYGANITFALYPVTNVVTHGTGFDYLGNPDVVGFPLMQGSAIPVAGSVFTTAAPPTDSQGKLAFSNSMPMPSVGDYVAAISVSAAPNNGVQMLIKGELQFRPEKIS